MLISLFIFILATLLLYFSSRSLLTHLLKLFSHLTKSKSTSLNLLFFLLLPGIFLHEFSHILSAAILQVPTGHLSLKPELKDNQLKLGSAQIARTDPIRLTLIGSAPFFSGTLILWLILTLGLNLNLTNLSLSPILSTPPFLIFLFTYLLFAITNTMFSSPSDLQAAALPIILLLIIIGIFQLTSLNPPQAFFTYSTNLFSLLTTIFISVFILNLILILPLKLITKNMLH